MSSKKAGDKNNRRHIWVVERRGRNAKNWSICLVDIPFMSGREYVVMHNEVSNMKYRMIRYVPEEGNE